MSGRGIVRAKGDLVNVYLYSSMQPKKIGVEEMSFRKFDTYTWNDPWFEKISTNAKLLFIYLFTNNTCNQAGMYQITAKRIKFESDIDIEKYISEIQDKVLWSATDQIVWVKNFFKHQCQNEKFARAALSSIKHLPDKYMDMFVKRYGIQLEKYGIALGKYHTDTISIPYLTEADTDTEADTEADTEHAKPKRKTKNKSNAKHSYAEFVSLTNDEYTSLVADYGEPGTQRIIEILDNYKGSTGKRYSSDYRTILNWVVQRYEEENKKNGGKGNELFSGLRLGTRL